MHQRNATRLVKLSPDARQQFSSLRRHYLNLERPGAVRNLSLCAAQAAARIERAPHLGLPAPRPYPWATRQGWRWIKCGPYWFAYVTREDQHLVTAIFHESADIPNRM